MVLVYLLAAAVVPLILTPAGLLFHFDIAPKIIVLTLAAALALVRFRQVPGEMSALWSRRPGRWLILLAVAQGLWFGVTTLTSSRPWFSVFGSGWRRMGLVEIAALLIVAVLVTAGLCERPDNTRTVLRMMVCGGLVASIYGICEYFGVDPLQPVAAYQAHAGDSVIVRPPGTMGHADYFGWWLAIELFCSIALSRMETQNWKQFSNFAAGCILIAIVFTGTRAALLAVVAGGIGLLLMAPVRLQKKRMVVAAVAAAVFAAFFISPAGTLLRARVVWSGDEPVGGARPLLWRDSLTMSVARPLVGFGPETYLTAFAPYQSEDLSRLFPDYHHESPHNLALDSLTSMGIPGLFLMVAWAGLAGLAVKTAMRSSSKPTPPLGAALIASATASMFSAASLGPLLLTALVTGILIAWCAPDRPITASVPGWTGLLGIAPALALIVFAAGFSVYEYRLEKFSIRPSEGAYQLVLGAALPGAADDLYASRLLQLECQKRTTLNSYVGCVQQMLQAAARGLRTDDDLANAWYNIAMLSAGQRNIYGTRQGLAKAMEVSPNWFKPHWTLALLLNEAGEKNQAQEQAVRAAFLDSNRDQEVVETLRKLIAKD